MERREGEKKDILYKRREAAWARPTPSSAILLSASSFSTLQARVTPFQPEPVDRLVDSREAFLFFSFLTSVTQKKA